MKSYIEEYQKKYEKPSVDEYIVGFSGLDPQKKNGCECQPTDLTPEQREIIRQLILAHLSQLTIRVDSGNLDEDADEPEVPYITLKPSEIPHEKLDGLLGGNTDGHYHLTEEQAEQLLKLIEKFIPDGENIEFNHEELTSLYGGDTDGHYHLTNDQLGKLVKILNVLFPDGAVDPVFPSNPDPTPTPTPDPDPDPDPEPEPEPEPDDPFGGLPIGTPPAWEVVLLPKISSTQCNAWGGRYKMYYGGIPTKDKTLTEDTLVVPMTGVSSAYMYVMKTTDGAVWETIHNTTEGYRRSISTYGTDIDDYLLTGPSSSGYYRLYYLSTPTSGKTIPYFGYSGGIKFSHNADNVKSTSYTAACHSPSMSLSIFVSQTGNVARLNDGATSMIKETTTIEIGMAVNPGCAAWSPDALLFCVTGPDGTATSSTGTTWELHTDTPKDLRDMSFREDLGCFFAWSGTDKKFYVSGDGKDWIKLKNTPIPLDEVACLDYSADLGWYCAIGGTSKVAYFSKDLEHWVSTEVTNGAAIEMNSVKYMPNVGKYILMPKSGSYYYTFNASDWTSN